MTPPNPPPRHFLLLTAGVWIAWWGLAALRHGLLRSNAFDLGIYDQVAWQACAPGSAGTVSEKSLRKSRSVLQSSEAIPTPGAP